MIINCLLTCTGRHRYLQSTPVPLCVLGMWYEAAELIWASVIGYLSLPQPDKKVLCLHAVSTVLTYLWIVVFLQHNHLHHLSVLSALSKSLYTSTRPGTFRNLLLCCG